MLYHDIHTHKQEVTYDEIAIVSIDIRKPFECLAKNNRHYATGVHPWYIDINDREATNRLFAETRLLASCPEIVAIGETGLDKNSANASHDFTFQQEIFLSHVRLSEEVKKPLIIHCVKAWKELLDFHQAVKPSVPWIIHGFRGKASLANQLLKKELYLSFGLHYQTDSLKTAWDNHRLFLETDNNNISIRDVYQQVAGDLGISKQVLSDEIGKIFANLN